MSGQGLSVVRAFAGAKAEYQAMGQSRFRRRRPGVSSVGGSADRHAYSEAKFIEMREYVRAMDRDDFLIGPLTDRCVENQEGNGYDLEVQIKDKSLRNELWQWFWDWANDPSQCDTSGVNTFDEMARLVARQELIDGDIFALPIEDGTLQLIEADRCRTPSNTRKNVVHGVELDGRRRRVQYYFAKDHIDPMSPLKLVSDTYQVDAYDSDGNPQVFPIFRPSRYSQTRGVTAYKAVVDLCGMIEDTNFATVVKQQIAACAVWSWEKGEGYDTGHTPNGGELEARELADFQRAVQEGVSPGQMFRPPKGMKLNVHTPQNIPSEQYFPHMKMLLTFIGMQIGMPLILILQDASETNFSGWRGAVDQARQGFRRNQLRRIAKFYAPVYRWRVRRFFEEHPIHAGTLKTLGPAVYAHKWNPPSWPYIQPEVDAKADAFAITNLLDSPRGIAGKNGKDIDDIIRETVGDNSKLIVRAIKAAQKIKAKTGVDVHWRDVANRDLPRGGQVIDQIEEENTAGGTKEKK